jgi:hypothetical protein
MRAAHGYTGAGHTLLHMAREIDRFQKARCKEIKRFTFTHIETAAFHATGTPLASALAGVEDEENGWVLRFEVERLVSKGTRSKGGGLFSGQTHVEDFYINTQRDETAERSCSAFDRHALLTASAYKALAHRPEFFRDTRVHVVSDDGRTLNENI